MAGKRGCYSDAQLRAAVDDVLKGTPVPEVELRTRVPGRTLRKWVNTAKNGATRAPQRRGPPPLLTDEAELSFYQWIIGRQKVGRPVGRQEILRKAREVSEIINGKSITDGWYRRFMERHPGLSKRVSQVISKSRNCVDQVDVKLLCDLLQKASSDLNLDYSRNFNMDETAFQSHQRSKQVVAARGSPNVWNTDPSTNFHLSIVVCGSAAGFVVPPLFILPEKTVKLDLMNDCEIPGAAVTTTPSAFINGGVFIAWLSFFASSVPAEVKRPLLLVMDGCSSHYSHKAVEEAFALGIMMILLPANATHLLQPLDVAVFSSFKSKLRRLIDEATEETESGLYTISKSVAIKVTSIAWDTCRLGTNLISGFETCIIYPISIDKMQTRLSKYKNNGTPKDIGLASWLRVKPQIQDSVLVLPSPPTKTQGRKRKTVTVAGRLLTQELLLEIAASQDTENKRASKMQLGPLVVNV